MRMSQKEREEHREAYKAMFDAMSEEEREAFYDMETAQSKEFPEEFTENGKRYIRMDNGQYECRDEKTGELLHHIRFD